MENTFGNIYTLLKNENLSVADVRFSITAYSLNTKLSFKFENARELKDFIGNESLKDTDSELIDKMIVDAGLKPESFFYVNFYKNKVTEL